jgi:hypothetical protein
MDPASLIIQCLSGMAGGGLAGQLVRGLSLGSAGNALSGLVGGGLGVNAANALLGMTPVQAARAVGNLDIPAIVAHAAGGGVGGIVMMTLVGLVVRGLSPRRPPALDR